MAEVFPNEHKVTRIDIPNAQSLPGSVRFRGVGGQYFDEIASIAIMSFTHSRATSHQFNHTLADEIYLYLFGDKINPITLSGVSFPDDCSGQKSSMEQIQDLYKQYKASNTTTAAPPRVEVSIGSTVITGYLTQLDISINDPVLRTVSFQMTMSGVEA